MNREKFSPEKHTQNHFPYQEAQSLKIIKNVKNIYTAAILSLGLSSCGTYAHSKTSPILQTKTTETSNSVNKILTHPLPHPPYSHFYANKMFPAEKKLHEAIKKTKQDGWKEFSHELAIISQNEYFGDFFKALIQQESKWEENAKSGSGAIGLAQITSSVINDMSTKARKDIYLARLVKIREKNPDLYYILPAPLGEKLKNIHANISDGEWENIRKLFNHNRKNPYVNLLLGVLTLDVKLEHHTNVNGKKFSNDFFNRLRKSGINTEILENIYPKTNQEARLVEAIWGYNGNNQKRKFNNPKYHKKGQNIQLEERDIHTIAVLENYHENKGKFIIPNKRSVQIAEK